MPGGVREMIDAIAEVEKHGGIRKAARANGIPYTTLLGMYRRQGGRDTAFFIKPHESHKYARILILDLEVSPNMVTMPVYDLKMKDKYINPDYITHDQTIIAVGWRWYGEDQAHCVSVSPRNPRDDLYCVQKAAELVNQADIVSGHNLDAFDLKILTMRLMTLGLPPIHRSRTIDTLKEMRKISKFASNRLSYLTERFGVSEKTEAPDWGLVMAGDSGELSKCREYCKDDVNASHDLLTKLMPHMKSTFDINAWHELPVYVCPSCGSHDTVKNGSYPSWGGARRSRYQCKSCGRFYSETTLMRRRTGNVKRV